MWRLQNDFQRSRAGTLDGLDDEGDQDDAPSFTEFTLDVKNG